MLVSSVLSLCILLSTTSITVYQHFCGAFLQDTSIIMPSDGCGMSDGVAMTGCEVNQKNSCCNDKSHELDKQDELELPTTTVNLKFLAVLPAVSLSIPGNKDQDKNKFRSYLPYRPPPPVERLYIVYQVIIV